MKELQFYLIGWCLLITALLISATIASIADRRAFMTACTADRPEYECVAMWRGGK